MEKAVFKFNADCGRSGSLEGVFISTKERVDKLISSGIQVYFGEVLGKHSEIYGAIERDEINLVSDNQDVVKVIEDFGLSSGFNPFDYTSIDFEIEGEDMEDMSVGEIIDKLLQS